MKTKLLAILTTLCFVTGAAFGGDPYRTSNPGEVDSGGNPIPAGSRIVTPAAKDLKGMQIALCTGPHGDIVWIRADILSAMSKQESKKLMSQVCQ